MVDRNKTEITHNATHQVGCWLDERGFKPVETEVGVRARWVADLVGVCCPTQTELIKLKLISQPPRWRSESDQPRYAGWRDAMEAIPKILTALVEVNTSVSDYRRDRETKWVAEKWPTNLCYVAIPEGMIPREEWPAGWGVILLSKEATTIRKTFPSQVRPVSAEDQLNVVLSLAVARDHVTRHARLREFQKRIRFEDADRKSICRISDAISFVRDVMRGRPVDVALRSRNIRAELPKHLLADLEGLRPAGPSTHFLDTPDEDAPETVASA